MPKPPPDDSWIQTTEVREGRSALTEEEMRQAFDRVDRRLARWSIFCGGVATGAVITGLLGWIVG